MAESKTVTTVTTVTTVISESVGTQSKQVYCSADTRERAVIPDIKRIFDKTGLAYEVKQTTCGDYTIFRGDEVPLACIERKTLPDYAASIKDGRSLNREKLIEARRQFGCALYYLIEQARIPADHELVSGIPYSTIAGSIMRLTIRDGIFVVYSNGPMQTAERLRDMVIAYTKQQASPESKVSGGNESITKLVIPKADSELVSSMWRSAGVTPKQAEKIIKQSSILNVVLHRVVPTGISAKTKALIIRLPDSPELWYDLIKGAPGWGPVRAQRLIAGLGPDGLACFRSTRIQSQELLRRLLNYCG